MAPDIDIDTSEKSRVLSPNNLRGLLASYSCGISYRAMQNEPDPLRLFPELVGKISYIIQPIPTLIPAEEAAASLDAVGKASGKVFILVPGRKFDAAGTRHGKGAGWYDRFLSIVPREWLRIGLCTLEEFSEEPLVRQAWDQEMDFVCVIGEE